MAAHMDKLNRCLERFGATKIEGITDKYTYFPHYLGSKLGSGSFGTVFRMKPVGTHKSTKPVVVKMISKYFVAEDERNIFNLCAELAVTGFVQHEHLNERLDLLHNDTHVFVVLGLCEGAKPDPLTRLYLMLSRTRPELLGDADAVVKSWLEDAADKEDHEMDSFIEEKMVEIRAELGLCDETPTSHDLLSCIIHNERLPERKAKIILKQIMLGLEHLHTNSIVHRDMKTENVVIAETRKAIPIRDDNGDVAAVRVEEEIKVKIIDFGLVKYMNLSQLPTSPTPAMFMPIARADGQNSSVPSMTSSTHNLAMTPNTGTDIYTALEAIRGELDSAGSWMSEKKQLPKLDVYGAGTALFCMLAGHAPFEPPRARSRAEAVKKLEEKVAKGPRFPTTFPTNTREMTELLMHQDIASRPTASEALAHPYFDDVGSKYVYEVNCAGDVCEIRTCGRDSREDDPLAEPQGAGSPDAREQSVSLDESASEIPTGRFDFMTAARNLEDSSVDFRDRSVET